MAVNSTLEFSKSYYQRSRQYRFRPILAPPSTCAIMIGVNQWAHPRRIFLLSPINAAGVRAKMITNAKALFPLAVQLREGGLPVAEAFSFISGLYFRGK